MLIPTLSKTLIEMGGENRISGITILNNLCRKIFNYDYSSEADRLKNWLSKSEIYLQILNKDMTE